MLIFCECGTNTITLRGESEVVRNLWNKKELKRQAFICCVVIACILLLTSACGKRTSPSTDAFVETSESLNEEDMTFMLADDMIEVENMSPYTGLSPELMDDSMLDNVYAFKFTNVSEQIIEHVTISFSNGRKEGTLELEMLLPGEPVFAAFDIEYENDDTQVTFESSMCTCIDVKTETQNALRISGDDGVLSVKNISDNFLPIVRVYYREFDDQDIYQGATCGCVIIDGIDAGEEADVKAEGWTNQCAIIYVDQIDE